MWQRRVSAVNAFFDALARFPSHGFLFVPFSFLLARCEPVAEFSGCRRLNFRLLLFQKLTIFVQKSVSMALVLIVCMQCSIFCMNIFFVVKVGALIVLPASLCAEALSPFGFCKCDTVVPVNSFIEE